MAKGLFQEFLRISTFGIILSVYYQTASPNRRPCKLCQPDLQPIIDRPSKEHAEAGTGKSELVKARLLGNQCVILPQTRIVSCCHNLLHPGKPTKRLMTQHDCLGKNCRYFEKYEDAGYWKECDRRVILVGIGRLFLFSLGDFRRGRLLQLGMGNSVGGIRGTASPISKSAACPSCSSMTASASVSTGSGAGCSGTAAFSTAGAGASAGGAASGMFFLSSAICKPPFRGMKKASPQTGRVEVTSLRGFIYENATRCPVGVALFSSF